MARKPATTKEAPASNRSRSATKKASTPEKASTPRKVKSPSPKTPKVVKTKVPKAPKAKVARKSKPTYEKMIFKALRHYGETTEASYIAICKFVESTYPVPEFYKRYIKQALKRAVDKGILLKVRASYRISAKGKVKKARAKSTSSRSASTSPRKSSTKSDKSPKKRKASSSPSPKKTTSTTVKKSRSTSNSRKSTSASSSPSPSPVSSPKKKERKSTKSTAAKKDDLPKKPADSKYDWVWQYQHGTWKNYDTEASDTVEEVYQGYLANKGDTDVRAVKSGQWEYQVDFMAMKQTNIQHDSHTVRNIRRVKAT